MNNNERPAETAAQTTTEAEVTPSAQLAAIPVLAAVRCMDKGFLHTRGEETCPFCDKGKIISGAWVQIGNTGHPCCENCYNKADGYNEWFDKVEAILPSIPKQFDWMMELYFKGYTPSEAVEDIRLVV